jgi:hypothetical protein
MAMRVLMQPGQIRISQPGQDVRTAAVNDLLLSLDARNLQVVQRGILSASSSSVNGFIWTADYSTSFPALPEEPHIYAVPIIRRLEYTQNGCTSSLSNTEWWYPNSATESYVLRINPNPSSFSAHTEVSCTRSVFNDTCGARPIAVEERATWLAYVVMRKRWKS